MSFTFETRYLDPQGPSIYNLPGGGTIWVVPQFLSTSEVNQLYRTLTSLTTWERGKYQMHGKTVETPRLLTSMWDQSLLQDKIDPASESQHVIWSQDQEWIQHGKTWHPLVQQVRDWIQKYLDNYPYALDYAQLNWYRSGEDYIGWHSDDEVPNETRIVSVSIGTPRSFVLRHKTTFKNLAIHRNTPAEERIYIKYEISLQPGMLFIMDQDAGKNKWKHTLKKEPKVTGDRINITFRSSQGAQR